MNTDGMIAERAGVQYVVFDINHGAWAPDQICDGCAQAMGKKQATIWWRTCTPGPWLCLCYACTPDALRHP